MINNKNLSEITKFDLQDIIDNKIIESKNLEYKKMTPDLTNQYTKSEFLADVSSFANANGGDIIYSIDEKNGIPTYLEGYLEQKDIDRTIRQIESILNSNIRPRILGLQIKEIEINDNKFGLIIRIPKSWNSPHRIILEGKNHNKFFTRGINGKYEQDIDELRIAFSLSDSFGTKIKNFREDRIYKIDSNELPISMNSKPRIIFHIIPLNSFNPNSIYDLSKISKNFNLFTPIKSSFSNDFGDSRYNIDGFLRYSASYYNQENNTTVNDSYVQIYRNGIIESVNSDLIYYNNDKYIDYELLEKQILYSYSNYKKSMQTLNINFPILIMLTILDVKGFTLFGDKISQLKYSKKVDSHVIDRRNLFLPEILIENNEQKDDLDLKPLFDSLWNSCGYDKSRSYDENNNFIYKN